MLHRKLLVVGRVNQLPGHQRREEEESYSGHRRSVAGRRNEAAHTTSWKCLFPRSTNAHHLLHY